MNKDFAKKIASEGIIDCLLYFKNAECKGKKIAYKKLENEEKNLIVSFETEFSGEIDVNFFCQEKDIKKFENSKIIYKNGKIIFSSKEISESCSCGSSFNFGENKINLSKIKNLKSIFDKKLLKIDTHKILLNNNEGYIFKNIPEKINIDTQEKSKNSIIGIIDKDIDIEINMSRMSKLDIKLLYFGNEKNINSKVLAIQGDNNSEINVDIVCLAGEKSMIEIDGIIDIKKNTKGNIGHLRQENIMLGKKSKVRGIPRLLASAKEIEASHSCKFEYLDNKKIFYLMSRGLTKNDAKKIIIESKIEKIIGNIRLLNIPLYEEIKKYINNNVKNEF